MSDKRSLTTYPVSLEIQYPDRDLKRAASVFRVILIIPIVAISSW
jgi:hypothetical protein